MESHNHPSYVEPFQGAATGVGGILRDVFTMGARPIAVLDSLRFGSITPAKGSSANGEAPEVVARNRRLFDGVVRGIAFYGNCFGVPTVGGEVEFEPGYAGNPLVNVLALGIAPKNHLFFARAPAKAIRSSTSAQRPAATAFTAPLCWLPPSSPRNRRRSAPTCKLAIRFLKSFCSRLASKPWPPARSSAFRIWALQG